ncbi:GSCFA domain-containing protein [Aquimarina brevivitae]|uniref:GSCFA family protein n=1 Tax=Aquimarina brevivitae TaxID=323412 RepID=A0A4Q7PHI2_9FLAO|nr:GSCFA domain-containing protein [Aquimarina brevivitae]RZS99865.1 GSCFA family protein [Aquimarina brevivitae]
MELQTNIKLSKGTPLIDYDSNLFMVGSCFAQHIGDKLEYFKFKNCINPFGILFHPKAIETFLYMATQQEEYAEEDIFFHNEQWHCFDAHSSLSSSDKLELLFNLNNRLINTYTKLRSATHAIITLGTSWVYRLRQLDMVVANCHKVPSKAFEKQLLSVAENEKSIENCIALLRSVNQNIKIIITVSPVRHLKDGMVENNLSKANLISAIHSVMQKDSSIAYFPSYEIMMDELRDYRFYNQDMIHPSPLAISYIWNKFKETWVSPDARALMQNIEEIQKGLAHRPFNPNSEAHQQFLEKLDAKKNKLTAVYPHIKF